ncbi:hypothetical protein S40285_02611 [Stachybotrys chlorohalonatus IBT 40285]|uniref:Ribonuclease H n=1 Tax=Stachybotrys chlorohalonatus (strain IBT 40285) TaxID=1283841 RepID=A0A084QXH8_STAC4|nr:hypothetical protein S40285_02611 [Stachybotrys chlorohalonata IBT 40285]
MPAAPKKRKMDNVQKFYAVKAGFIPGVYEDYSDCQAQTAGFKGAICQFAVPQGRAAPHASFTSREDAEAFAAGKKVNTASNEPEKFYAVAVGHQTGIFTDWADASQSITGVKGPKYKRFATRREAVDYIRQFGNREAIEALGEEAGPVLAEERPAKKVKVANKHDPPSKSTENVLKIYTDGSSLANGRRESRAGLGVFFGDGDARNISERLPGEPQTNQRAELMAMLRAMEVAPLHQTIQIISDSKYSINCVTEWAKGWEKKDWKTATGEKVKNQDIIRACLQKMGERTSAGSGTYFVWVKGHATDKGNIAADALAVRGARS